jgi:Uma2 family endonuclease
MATELRHFVTPEEYLEIDSKAERPSEYLNGQIVEIEDATLNHTRIANLTVKFSESVRTFGCEVYSHTLRVHMPLTGLYAYPDIVITCGREQFAANDTPLNPILIAEVLSPSIQEYDCGSKFAAYRSIPSLQEYLTVAQDKVEISQWALIAGKWTLNATYTDLAADLTLLATAGSIPLNEIYRNVSETNAG